MLVKVIDIGLMRSDMISWFIFENSTEIDDKTNGIENQIPENADISITSSLYTYKLFPMAQKSTLLDTDTPPIVLIDELYRPGTGVLLTRSLYGAYKIDTDADIAEIFQVIESIHASNIVSNFHLDRKGNLNQELNLFVTNSEKWERRKNLSGVVLKTTSVAV